MKIKTSVTLDQEVWIRIKNLEVNLSEEVNEFLKARLNIKKNIDKENLLKRISELRGQKKKIQMEEYAINNKLNEINKKEEKKKDNEANATLDALKASGVLGDSLD